MYRINQIKISAFCENVPEALASAISKKYKTKVKADSLTIIRRSLDARDKNDIKYVYSVDINISKGGLKYKDNNVTEEKNTEYVFPYKNKGGNFKRPVIVGFGPAGMFCAYMLAKAGFRPIVLERGKRVEERKKDVENFFKNNILLPSNVQFGEGGAGTFSDGKLNTAIKDRYGRNHEVLKTFVRFGAKEEIIYDNKPHVGTDVLEQIVRGIREAVIENGGEIHYESKADALLIQNGCITGVKAGDKAFDTDKVVLCIGHSARDTFGMLRSSGVKMSPKAFAIGLRIMHPQHMIDADRYGEENVGRLPVADYKLTCKAGDRGVYSFCMCPGGYVINASSEKHMTCVNGMSYSGRDSGVANSAILVQVTPDDFGNDDVLAGVEFQRKLERAAYDLADGMIPLQKYGDFRFRVTGETGTYDIKEFEPACKGLFKFADLSGIMPKVCNESLVEGMEHFGKIIKGFNDGNAILAGVESRTSSPVRIERDEKGESEIKGLYPCGEGAGYAGGIASAAMDGIFIAETVAEAICKEQE
ncbi:MAG: FAD-dependent oxidoreductase [Lachnospiraceae bacterium]|nr:FAD-dependent oxidoreductase [Lachnospiraceae bacterium]